MGKLYLYLRVFNGFFMIFVSCELYSGLCLMFSARNDGSNRNNIQNSVYSNYNCLVIVIPNYA